MKRLFDLVGSFFGLALLAPVMLIVAFLVMVLLGRPVIFRQERPGYQGRIFQMYKFRSMSNKVGVDGELLPDEQRLGSFGRFLRKSSLDELPELFNVLKGDMSLVGPRPLLVEYLPLYTKKQARRHDIRPGITGWAQVNGRNAITWEEKFDLDVWYVDNRTFALDLRIILMTILKVFRGSGVSQSGYVTAAKFTGSQRSKE